MTARLAAAALLLIATLAAAVTLLGAIATPEPAESPATVTAQLVEATAPAEVDPLLVALVGPGTDLAPAQAEALLLAADRVCEGVAAEVPVVVMADALVADLGLTDTEARTMVNVTATTYCAA